MEIRQTDAYRDWFGSLKDLQARARILARIRRLSLGNPGDNRHLGDGVCELRVHHGPGYRIYYSQRGDTIVILLCGGDKDSQRDDIRRAKALAKSLED